MQEPPPAACGDYSGSQDDLIATCNPWANRDGDTDGAGPDIGDFMILWDQQGGSKDLFLRTWTGTAPNLTLGAPVLLNANVSDAEYSADGFFGEGAVNLTDTVFGGSNACRSFANVIPSTVTGNSDTADYKDTILQPVTPIGNCTSTTVTTPKDGAGANIPAGGLSITTAGVVQVKDSALVDIQGGTATPAGTVDVHPVQGQNAADATVTRAVRPYSWTTTRLVSDAAVRIQSRWSHRPHGSPRPVGTAGRPSQRRPGTTASAGRVTQHR